MSGGCSVQQAQNSPRRRTKDYLQPLVRLKTREGRAGRTSQRTRQKVRTSRRSRRDRGSGLDPNSEAATREAKNVTSRTSSSFSPSSSLSRSLSLSLPLSLRRPRTVNRKTGKLKVGVGLRFSRSSRRCSLHPQEVAHGSSQQKRVFTHQTA